MKKYISILALLFVVTIATAQTQLGYVKTKGRMENGKLVHGQGLKGATVSIKGRSSVLVDADDGSFSFPVPAQAFKVENVQKNGYQLVDADVLGKLYKYSSNPLYLVMETPEQQFQDQLAAERKIRNNLQKQLQKCEKELEERKAQGKLTDEEYHYALKKVYDDQEKNDHLIRDMAKRYSEIDYDQLDELNGRIGDAILDGRLLEADSLLRSKGNMGNRIAELRHEIQVEAQREEELKEKMDELNASKAGTQKKLDDIATDCYHFFERFKNDWMLDSASYYIELRAELDTTNVDWQFDAADFFNKYAFHIDGYSSYGKTSSKTKKYYSRTVELRRAMNDSSAPNQFLLSVSLANYADYYNHLFCEWWEIGVMPNAPADSLQNVYYGAQSELLYTEALNILRQLAQSDFQSYGLELVSTLNNLIYLYRKASRFDEAIAIQMEALEVCRKLVQLDSKTYEIELLKALDDAAWICLYGDADAEPFFLEELKIYRRLDKDCPQEEYKLYIVDILKQLAEFVYSDDSKKAAKCEATYLEALEILESINASKEHIIDLLDKLASFYEKNNQPEKKATIECKMIATSLPAMIPQGENSNFKIGSSQYGTEIVYNGRVVIGTKLWKYNRNNPVAMIKSSGFSNDGKYCAKSTKDKQGNYVTIIYDVASNKAIDTIQKGFISTHMVFSPDNKYFVISANNPIVYVYDIRTGEEVFMLWGHHNGSLSKILYSTDGRYIVTASINDNSIIIWNAHSGQRMHKHNLIHSQVVDVAITPDNRFVFSASKDGVLKKWNIETGEELWSTKNQSFDNEYVFSMACSPTGNHFAVSYTNKTIVIYDAASGAVIQTIQCVESHRKILYSLDGILIIASDSYNGKFIMYGDEAEAYQNSYVNALGSQSFRCIFAGQLEKSEQYAREALSIDPTQHWIYTNLAAALLFKGKYNEAEQIYCQFKDELKKGFLQDFNEYESAGVIPEERKVDVERIKKLLE